VKLPRVRIEPRTEKPVTEEGFVLDHSLWSEFDAKHRKRSHSISNKLAVGKEEGISSRIS
jgi:hypothetical protein